jgi:hypothetical protein
VNYLVNHLYGQVNDSVIYLYGQVNDLVIYLYGQVNDLVNYLYGLLIRLRVLIIRISDLLFFYFVMPLF